MVHYINFILSLYCVKKCISKGCIKIKDKGIAIIKPLILKIRWHLCYNPYRALLVTFISWFTNRNT